MTGSRVFWITVAAPLVVGALGIGTMSTLSAIAHREERISETWSADGITSIEIHGEGRVQITGADTDTISLDMRVSHGLRDTGHTEAVVDGVLVLDVGCPIFLSDYCQVDHTLVIPHDLAVWVHNNSARTILANLDGDLDINNDSGRIEATGLASANAKFSNDSARITVEFVEPPDHLAVDNDSGRIEIVVPEVDGGYAVETDNDSGSTDVSVETDSSSAHAIQVENDSAGIVVRNP